MSLFHTRRGDALLVVDAQVGALEPCWEAERVIAAIADLVARARIAGTPVVWVRDEDLGSGTDAWQVVPQLIPEPGETIIEKRFGDAFAETDLDDVLGLAGANQLWLAGARSEFCVIATLFGGLHRGYDVTLVEDTHTTCEATLDGVRVAAPQLVAMVNRLAWTTELPSVRSQLVRAADVTFLPADRPDDEDLLELSEADEQAEEDADDVALGLADEPRD